jgi:vacuolar-type H+-ATPase subunit E/Vma4
MALEHLVEVLRREAEAESAAILAEARAHADTIHKESETEISRRRAAVQAAAEADRRVAVELALVAARRSARKELLEARQRLLDRVFAAARERFPERLGSPDYLAVLPAQVAEALECLGKREGTFRFHPKIRQQVEPLLRDRAGIHPQADSEVGAGFRLTSQDGLVEIDGTLEDRLARLATRAAVEVMARFGSTP